MKNEKSNFLKKNYIFLLKFAETTDTLLKGINNKRKKTEDKSILNPM